VTSGGATYTAVFQQQSQTAAITVLANPSNGGTTAGAGAYAVGSQQQISATPYSGWAFTGWADGPTQNPRTIVVPAGGATYTADFQQQVQTATITVLANPSNGGTTAGSGTYVVGSQQQISASPSTGWAFTGWSDGSSQNPETITVPAGGATYTANFTASSQGPYTVATSSSPSGAGATSGGGSYTNGASVTVTATASSCYSFVNWTENGNVVSSSAGYTFAVTGNRNLVANFLPSSSCNPQITSVGISGSSGNYTVTVNGSGFGIPPSTFPFTGDSAYFRIADAAQIGYGEWGYTGDGNMLTYQSWSDTQIQVSGFGGHPGDAIIVGVWNPVTGAGMAWGGNVPGGSGTPQITSVTFSGNGTNLQIYIAGTGFGSAPTNMPFAGDLNQFIFGDSRTHSGGGSALFEAGGALWGQRSPDAVTLIYQSWSDSQIVIGGFAGAYGQGAATYQASDPVTIEIWNTSDTDQTGPQTAWGGIIIPRSSFSVNPQITGVVFSGSPGNYTVTVNGSGFGNLQSALPFTGDTSNFRIADAAQLGYGEWGYTGDGNMLTYQSWSDTQIQVSGFGGQPGDAIAMALWNPVSGGGATWGGNVPGGTGTPQITSVTFSGAGSNLQMRIVGSGFGNAPTNMPFTGDLNQFIFGDFSTHSGGGSSLFEAGGALWGVRQPDAVTLNYVSWSDTEIVISGFAGAYGQGNAILQNGDPVTIEIWNASDSGQTGPQTAWGGVITSPATVAVSPVITSVVFSGSPGNYTVMVNGVGFGNLESTFPFSGDSAYFRIADAAQIGYGEWGYTGDGNMLTYQSWSDTQIQVSGFGGQPGDAIALAVWNPVSGGGATWGGNVPGGTGTPQITSVTFSGTGSNLQMYIAGSGFGNAPTNMPFTGDLDQFIFGDFSTHSGGGSSLFEAGGSRWGHGSPDAVTLTYQSWSDTEIVINGFAGAYGQGNAVLQSGDPVTIEIWNTSDADQTGPQTAWGGVASSNPQIASVVFSGSPGNYTVTVNGSGFGDLQGTFPFSGDTSNLRIFDAFQLGHGEWGYTGDGNVLTYQSWSDTQVQVGAFGGQPGDAINLALWNPVSGAGVAWGGNIPGTSSVPQIVSVTFSGSGSNLQIYIAGSGFGNAPTNMPFTGDLNYFSFDDFRTHCGGGSSLFEAGASRWGHGSPNSLTLNYQAWSDTEIVISGFSGSYGQGCDTVQSGDPVAIVLWNTADTDQTGPQTAWGGFLIVPPPSITSQPQSETVTVGANVTFSVTATGTAPLSYQWQKDGVNLVGATNATLILSNVSTNDSSIYDVVVSNAFGSVTSWTAPLTVTLSLNVSPQITGVVFSGSAGNYTVTVTGSGFGNLESSFPFTGDTANFRIADAAQIGYGEWGYSGDGNMLTYESWSDTKIQVSGFGGQPGDAINLALWNPASGAVATWGGNVPGGTGTPQISSVTFFGTGSNVQMYVAGSGFGNAPTNMPFTGDLNQFIFGDFRTHSGGGSSLFEAGGGRWGQGSPDAVTLTYQSWSDSEIVISGFAGAYGQGAATFQASDPVTIEIWNTSDTDQTGPQTAWGGIMSVWGLTPLWTTNGFSLMLRGPVGSNYVVEASSDLAHWQAITNFVTTASATYFADPAAASYNQRYYRVATY
jgi:hypothetical protein